MTTVDEADLVARLQAGDEDAFVAVVRQYHAPLLRLAASYVPSHAVAEEVVQDTWLGVVRGIDRFEGRSSLKTWLFRIVVNRARTAGAREHRESAADPAHVATVAPDRFGPAGQWVEPPAPWTEAVEDRLAARQALDRIAGCLTELPENQRRVVTMRDLEGLTAQEVCSVLGISEANQRVLLHRGRARVRGMLAEQELVEG